MVSNKVKSEISPKEALVLTARHDELKRRLTELISSQKDAEFFGWELSCVNNFLKRGREFIEAGNVHLAGGFVVDAEKYLDKYTNRINAELSDFGQRIREMESEVKAVRGQALFQSKSTEALRGYLEQAREHWQLGAHKACRTCLTQATDKWVHLQFLISLWRLTETLHISENLFMQWLQDTRQCLLDNNIKSAVANLHILFETSYRDEQIEANERRAFWCRLDLLRKMCKPSGVGDPEIKKEFTQMIHGLRAYIETGQMPLAAQMIHEIGDKFVRQTTHKIATKNDFLTISGSAHPGSKLQMLVKGGAAAAQVETVNPDGDFCFKPFDLPKGEHIVVIYSQTFRFIENANVSFSVKV
jgi:hypothetical protein